MRRSMPRVTKGLSWTHLRFALWKTASSSDFVVATILRKDLTCATGISSALVARVPWDSSLPCLQHRRQCYMSTGRQPYRFLHASSWSLSAAKQKAVHLTAKEAKKYVVSLTPQGRDYIQTALDECTTDSNGARTPSFTQLRYGRRFLAFD